MKILKSALLMSIFFVTGCGGTTGGNPSATITLQSAAYTNNGAVAQVKSPLIKLFETIFPIKDTIAAPVSSFKFCITKMKVVTTAGGLPGTSKEAILGLVDVSDATKTTNWGNIQLTDGEIISEIHLEIHKDAQNCSGINYSLTYNNKSLSGDLEFKFKFSPAIKIQHGKTLQINLSAIAKAVEDSDVAGELDDAHIKNYLKNTTYGSGTELD